MDNSDKCKTNNLDLQNVQSWPNQLGAFTTPNSRPNGAARAVVLETLKAHKTLAQLSSEFGIHASQITQWKQQALEGLPTLFNGPVSPSIPEHEREQIEAPLFQQIGQLKQGGLCRMLRILIDSC